MLNKEKGITLTEILFSALIIALVMVGVLGVFVKTADMSRRINHEYAAMTLTKNRIERARTVMGTSGFDFLSDLEETDRIVDQYGVPAAEGNFKRTTQITPQITQNFTGDPRLTRITVSVTYKYRDSWRENAIVDMTTIFTNVR